MKPTQSFNSYIENSIKDNWDRDALTDYKGATLQYHDVARKIAKLHILFRHSGLQPGDKVALCGRNSSAWAAAFLATHTTGDTHLYLNHLEQARLQLSRTPRPLPTMRINPDVKSIFDFRYEDFELENYDPWPHIAAEVSV